MTTCFLLLFTGGVSDIKNKPFDPEVWYIQRERKNRESLFLLISSLDKFKKKYLTSLLCLFHRQKNQTSVIIDYLII